MKRFGQSRRLFLGGAGTLLALPFLESLMPRTARAGANDIKRIIAFYVPNGMHMANFTPVEEGAQFTLPTILEPLAPFQNKINVLTGLANTPARPDGPGDHASGTSGFLTCRHVVKTEGAGIRNGISMDQVAAATLGQQTRIPSLQLGIDGGSSAGDCDNGYSCAYSRNISWASETQPLPKSTNPRVVWDILFGGFDSVTRTSVLDSVLEESLSLSGKLGTTDKRKLDEYMTGIRELEKKIQKTGTGPVCTAMDRPPAELPLPEHVKMMLDLTALVIQCDATRVVSFMLANAGSNRTYAFLGVNDAHHQISHHQGLQANFDKLTIIDRWEVEQLAYLLGKLEAIDEGNGVTALDNSVVYFSSEIEDGNTHVHTNLPIVLGGGLGGAWTTGRHIVYPADQEIPLANLFISMLRGAGVTIDTFGDNGKGPLEKL
ncbi:MAG TPA: DUF1552 domain-containing protein [Polyangium sp.]|nr:DUF1552 domain-containing protein [Polyangium sp.]